MSTPPKSTPAASFRIRQALLKDRDDVMYFHRALYQDYRSSLIAERFGRLYAYRDFGSVLADDVDAMLRNPATAILLAEVEGKAIGYITGYIETNSRRVLSRKGVVGDWFVSGGMRGLGAGQKLLDALMAIFRESGCSVAEIATWPFNTNTRRFIESAGFSEIQVTYRQELGGPDES